MVVWPDVPTIGNTQKLGTPVFILQGNTASATIKKEFNNETVFTFVIINLSSYLFSLAKKSFIILIQLKGLLKLFKNEPRFGGYLYMPSNRNT